MRRDLGIGITGSGFMGRTHAEAVLAVPGFRLAAVTGGRRAAGLAERFGIDEEPDVEHLVRRPDLDAVIVMLEASRTGTVIHLPDGGTGSAPPTGS